MITFPVIFGFGFVANIVVLALMLRKKLRGSTTSLYLACLAVTDILILIAGCMKRWIHYTWPDLSFSTLSDTTCKASVYIALCLEFMETWLVVSITLERLVAVLKPLSLKIWFSWKRAGLGIIMTVLASLVLYMSLVPFLTLEPTLEGQMKCDFKASENVQSKLLLVSLAIITWIVPYFIIMASNAIIIKNVKKAFTFSESSTTLQKKRAAESRSLTHTLVLATFAAVVLTAPRLIIRGVAEAIHLDQFTPSDDAFWWVFIICDTLYYLNSAINIILYTTPGTRYRKELIAMLSCCRKTKSPANLALQAI